MLQKHVECFMERNSETRFPVGFWEGFLKYIGECEG